MLKFVTLCATILATLPGPAQQFWSIEPDGKTLRFAVTPGKIPHSDHMEMSGEQISFVLRWSLDKDGNFSGDRSLVFPMLRTIPNDTHASLTYRMNVDIPSLLSVNNLTLTPAGTRYVEINGAMKAVSDYRASRDRDKAKGDLIEITRIIFPSTTLPLMCERYEVCNKSSRAVRLTVPDFSQVVLTPEEKGVAGSYIIRGDIQGSGEYRLGPGETAVFDAVFQAYGKEGATFTAPSVTSEYGKRMDFIGNSIDTSLILETPDQAINAEFRYAKIRGSESIYKTKRGYMHSPGGESYYAAVWANDQAEYINPFFPFLGYDTGNESALNSFRLWFPYMNDEYGPLPSSIISEGDDSFSVAGDRGDAAMIAYGAARYALARGDRDEAKELWPLIEWCLEYCARKVNAQGVVESDTDELENRFPSGDANLCTSTLYYDALLSAVYLGKEIGVAQNRLNKYSAQAKGMRKAIETYFGATVSGYRTYRYYEGNDILRSWICMPLIAGIHDRAAETVKALFGPELYTKDGCLTAEHSSVFWDRSTLYAFRGVFQAGYPDLAVEQLSYYSNRRLLGNHVPYPIEAWPEGSQRHLAAESGLYCRIVTEGMFGIRPTSLSGFELTPQLPSSWDSMALRNIRAFGADFDIEVERAASGKLKVAVTPYGGKAKLYNITEGKTIGVKL